MPTIIPTTFVAAEVGHHGAQAYTQCSYIGADGTTSRCYTFAGGKVGKVVQLHIHQPAAAGIVQHIFNNTFFGFKRPQFIQSHTFNSNLDQFFFAYTGAALLLL